LTSPGRDPWPSLTPTQLNCIAEILPEVGCSSATDFACACRNIERITAQGLECFTSNCDTSEIVAAQSAAASACAAMETMPTFGTADSTRTTATTTVMGSITDLPPDTTDTDTATTSTPSVTVTVSGTTVETTTVTTPTGSDTTSDSSETSSTGSPTESDNSSTTTTSPPDSTETGGDGEGVGAKPLAGAGLALFAAMFAL
jgi:hypothetical protein